MQDAKIITSSRIIIALGIILEVAILYRIIFTCWQYHQDKEFAKNLECKKLGQYYDPKSNECADENYCLIYPDNYWCKSK